MDDHFQTPRGYALSGKIMLTAIIILFAVIIIMIFVHLYARCYIHRARRRRTHLIFYIDSPHNTISTHRLDPAVLKSLPTFTFSKAEDAAEKVVECAVCLSEFEVAEELRLLPKCKHCFHVECIDMWFHSHSTCPLCRSPVEACDATEVVVELTPSQLEAAHESTRGDAVGPSCSLGGRRKGVESVEVPRRSESFESDESGPSRSPGFKSPTSRILSLKRILSREKKSPLPSPSGAGSRCCELDVELGRVDSSSQGGTPK